MRKLFFLLAGFVLFIGTLQAQNRTLSGKVTDEKGAGVAGVSITVKGSTAGTTSGSDGSYSFTAPATSKILVFTSVSFTKEEVAINGKTSIDISLKVDDKLLEEVVVTGYSSQKKSQFTGAATVLSNKVVDGTPLAAFDQALQGRVPGMVVNSGSGQPGASANVTIRGIQSISGAGVQPLYVLDGIPIPAGDMQGFNPNDFESITILKDAGAAAMYGSRGGTGVIVLTSKKGKIGQTNFTFRTQFGFTQPPNPSNFNMMNSTELLEYEKRMGLAGAGGVTGPGWFYSRSNPANAAAPAATLARYDFILDSFRNNNANFYNYMFRTGISQTHEINVNGGSEKTKYYLSGQVFDQKGIDVNSRLRRYQLRFNLDQTVGKLNVQFNNTMALAITNSSEGDWLGNSPRNPFQIVWRARPYETPYTANGTLVFGASSALKPTVMGNAIEGLANSFLQERQLKINTGLTLAYKILPSLTAKNVLGVDVSSNFGLRGVNANSYIGSLQTFNSGFLSEAYVIRTNMINTSSLVFNKVFGNHDVEFGGYFEAIKVYNKGFGFNMWNLDPRLSLTGQGAGSLNTGVGINPQNSSSAKSEAGIRSYFANGRYTYNNKYTITGGYRRDATSRIANTANQSISSWSTGFSWDIIKEGFMLNQKMFSNLKARVSYGIVPNIGSIATASFGTGSGLYGVANYLGPQLPAYGNTTGFTGSPITGQVPTTPGNPSLRIETISKLNFGLDLSMWKNKVRVNLDVYSNETKDLFVSLPLNSTTGFGGTSLPINAGIMSNKGVELNIEVDVIRKRDFDMTIGWNHAINNNLIVDLGPVNEYPAGTGIIRKGLPFGSHYSFNYLGADPATGRPTYEKADGKVTTNFNEAARFAKFGTYLPKHVGGFNLDLRYRRISVSALFSYQFEVFRYNNVESWTTRGTPGYAGAVNQNKILLTEQWQKPGDQKYYSSPLYDRDFTSADIHDAKFLRFRTLNVAYTIPGIGKPGSSLIKSAKFYMQGQNLAIWSPWRGLDPEDSNNISLQEFPNPRMFVVGLDVNF